jgi:ABC-type multidrug transport system permease subunit
MQTLMMSYLSNLSTFGPDKIVMQREMESGLYRLPAFFFSRWIVELPFRIIFPIVYSAILYFMVGLQEVAEKFALFTLALILLNNCGTAFAVMICSAFPEVQQAMQFGPMFMLPLLVFSGLYVNLTTLGWYFRWLAYISPIRYGYGAVIKTEMDGLEFTCEAGASSCIKTGAQVIRGLGIADDPTAGQNLMILTGVLMFYLSAGYFFMWRTTKKR